MSEASNKQQMDEAFEPKSLRRMGVQILEFRGTVLLGLAFLCLSSAAAVLEPQIFARAIDVVLVGRQVDRLQFFVGVFFLLHLVRTLAAGLNTYVFTILGQKVMLSLRQKILERMLLLSVEVYDRTSSGRMVTRVTNDIAALGEMFAAGILTIGGNLLQVLGTIGMLFWIDSKLAAISLSILVPTGWLTIRLSHRLRKAYREARNQLSQLNAFLAENLNGQKVIQVFGRSERQAARFGRVNHLYCEAQTGTIRVYALLQPLLTVAMGISMALVMAQGAKQVIGTELTVGELTAFFSYIMAVYQPIREILDKWNVFLAGMTSAERIFKVLDEPLEMPLEEGRTRIHPPEVRGEIEFQNVWFAYSGENWVLKDFSAQVKPGQKIGVVGHTGAGKTTLLSLLLRFREPQRGRILLDGKDLREWSKRELRSAFGWIQQDVFLFSGEPEQNLLLWREGLELQEEARNLLEREGILKKHTLEERGGNLSVGERQWMAFGRALVAKPSVWILDEATAHVDTESEKKLEWELLRSSVDTTLLVIAHRLASVRDADQIWVLHQGKMVENGTYLELIKKDGYFAKMTHLQKAMSLE